jgi:lipopolysaccharide export system protein LptA
MRRWGTPLQVRAAVAMAAMLLMLPASGAGAQPGKEQSGGGVQSLGKSNKGPINIQSDSLELRDKDKTATFINNVRLVQDDTVIECKVLVVYYEDDPKAAPKTGGSRGRGPQLGQAGEQQISRVEAKGGVILTQKDQTATGDNGVYDVKANTFTLVGDVVLTQGQNVVRGDRLWVDLTTNLSRVESKKTGPGRVQGLFQPNSPETKRPQAPPGAANGAARGAHNASSEKDKQKPTSSRPLRLN